MDEKVTVNQIKLHLGCGPNKLEGWVNVDSVQEFHPDLLHDITQRLPYEDQTVDEVLAEGLLEHFDKYMRYLVFYEWTRVLKVGGKITLQIPDFKMMLKRFSKFGFDNFVDALFGENMYRSEVYIGHFGNHKYAYSPESLIAFVKKFGIEPFEVDSQFLNINFKGEKKRHIAQDELEQIHVYSHANAHGEGEAQLPLSFVKEKINIFNRDFNNGAYAEKR